MLSVILATFALVAVTMVLHIVGMVALVTALGRRHPRAPDVESAFYFSGVTYATVGYGDVVLAQPWRMLGPIEGLTGILMCGLSTGLFFAIINRLVGPRLKGEAGNGGVPQAGER